MPPIRYGSVPFINAWPLTEGLELFCSEPPARLSKTFCRGEVDVALLSSFEAFRIESSAIVPGMAIASGGPVGSVLLFRSCARADLSRVLVDESSLTSAALVRLLLPPEIEFAPCRPDVDPRVVEGDGVMLIGDAALTAPIEGLEVDDLAVLWREQTGLPFTFAVWLARDEEVARAAAPELLRAKERGLANRAALAERAARKTGLPEAVLLRYLTERITYDLGPAERDGLALFEARCRERGLLPRAL